MAIDLTTKYALARTRTVTPRGTTPSRWRVPAADDLSEVPTVDEGLSAGRRKVFGSVDGSAATLQRLQYAEGLGEPNLCWSWWHF